MNHAVRRMGVGYLLLLRGIGVVAGAVLVFVASGAIIVLPLWFVSTSFPRFYSIAVPVLCCGALLLLGLRGIQRRARERREVVQRVSGRTKGLRLLIAGMAALLSVYFLAALAMGSGIVSLVWSLLAALLAGFLARGLGGGQATNGAHSGALPKDREH